MAKKHKIMRIRGEKTYASDVDETLVMMDHIPDDFDRSKLIKVNNNKNKPGAWAYAIRHERHIELMRQMAARGFAIVVWSAGGEDWAWYIVHLLGLEGLVDATMGKPDWFADDKKPEDFLKGRVYLDMGNPTKDLRGFVVDALNAGVDPDDLCEGDKDLKRPTDT